MKKNTKAKDIRFLQSAYLNSATYDDYMNKERQNYRTFPLSQTVSLDSIVIES